MVPIPSAEVDARRAMGRGLRGGQAPSAALGGDELDNFEATVVDQGPYSAKDTRRQTLQGHEAVDHEQRPSMLMKQDVHQ